MALNLSDRLSPLLSRVFLESDRKNLSHEELKEYNIELLEWVAVRTISLAFVFGATWAANSLPSSSAGSEIIFNFSLTCMLVSAIEGLGTALLCVTSNQKLSKLIPLAIEPILWK